MGLEDKSLKNEWMCFPLLGVSGVPLREACSALCQRAIEIGHGCPS